MKIENQTQYDAAEAKTNAMMGKGGRLLALDNKIMFSLPMTDAERSEHAVLLAEYSEICAAMREYNTPAMQKLLNSLSAD